MLVEAFQMDILVASSCGGTQCVKARAQGGIFQAAQGRGQLLAAAIIDHQAAVLLQQDAVLLLALAGAAHPASAQSPEFSAELGSLREAIGRSRARWTARPPGCNSTTTATAAAPGPRRNSGSAW